MSPMDAMDSALATIFVYDRARTAPAGRAIEHLLPGVREALADLRSSDLARIRPDTIWGPA